MNGKIIELFEAVQSISYRCRNQNPSNLSLNLRYANCNQKRDLLKQEVRKYKIESRNLDAIFNWKDLPLPKEILKILRKSGTFQKHHLLEIKINDNYFKIDPTWDLELEVFGFPVTKNWDSNSNTEQVTKGKILFYDSSSQNISLPYYPEERKIFADEFNRWIKR